MKLFHCGSLLMIALSTGACSVSFPVIALAPPGVHVRPEVARGYRAFEPVLAEWGDWAPDYTYGVHWCPSRDVTGGPGVPFQPYLHRGRWGLSEAPIGEAPAGSPEWQSEDSDTWGKITSHHGWWVRVPERRGSSPWCWVPGAEETPARVAWREGDGFVGWAPEPPIWIVADAADYEDGVDWVFSLLGTLLEDGLDGNVLTGDAREQARSSTAPAVGRGGAMARHEAPPSGDGIRAARQSLADHAVKHPEAIAANTPKSGGRASGSSGSSGSSASIHRAEAALRSASPGEHAAGVGTSSGHASSSRSSSKSSSSSSSKSSRSSKSRR